ncbi:hypothetical protein J4573_15155 [Actinomadura barringtoniae]|uniref:Uncharacterized protein n=1 Tax=Actinomadura barringtoniae TaxID=1427535 RepID=A0A939P9R3_9ACTN|nr:hypothetical protein [Actinomadura barringtoniae]MBO2448438.1 hypothetical protein [Actinomadura barringtoniae]
MKTATPRRVRGAAVLGGLSLALGAGVDGVAAAGTGSAGAAVAGASSASAAGTSAAVAAPVKPFDVCYPKAKKCSTAKNRKLRAHGTITFGKYATGKVSAYNKLGGKAYFYVTAYTKRGTHNTQSHAFTKKLERGFGYPAASSFITKYTVKVCQGTGAKARCSATQTITTPKLPAS